MNIFQSDVLEGAILGTWFVADLFTDFPLFRPAAEVERPEFFDASSLPFRRFNVFSVNPHSEFRIPHSAFPSPQSPIANRQSAIPLDFRPPIP